jgi:hypothetical protein
MKKLMMMLLGILIAGAMVSGCGQKQEAAQEAPAMEQAAPAADQAAPAAGENTPVAEQAAPVAAPAK